MWTATLANILGASDQRWGAKWAWRVVRFVHALPFLALAFGFGIVNGWAWDFSPMISAVATSSIVAVGMAISWFKEWRRGY